MLLSSIIGNLGKFIRLKISGPAVEQDDGLNSPPCPGSLPSRAAR